MKTKGLLILFFSVLELACASPGFGPNGFLVTQTKIGIFGTGEKSQKFGKACVFSLLGLFAYGDGSIENAKRKANINIVEEINWETISLFGIYSSLCVEAGGK
ncbi:TRL-like family protein [Leptospira ilyithenensis]|uniref:TRL-like family protein n=2 Tax=Leptospira ilyithenensis TaxID=2484901 RepID=A0A4R9LUS3_9LEPT|nr:TRL-like family protein [Leptospira ilyithenensis]